MKSHEELGRFELGVSSATPTGGTPGRRNIIPARTVPGTCIHRKQAPAQARRRERAGSACARELSPKHETDPSRHTRPDTTSTPRAAAARAPVEAWGTQSDAHVLAVSAISTSRRCRCTTLFHAIGVAVIRIRCRVLLRVQTLVDALSAAAIKETSDLRPAALGLQAQ